MSNVCVDGGMNDVVCTWKTVLRPVHTGRCTYRYSSNVNCAIELESKKSSADLAFNATWGCGRNRCTDSDAGIRSYQRYTSVSWGCHLGEST